MKQLYLLFILLMAMSGHAQTIRKEAIIIGRIDSLTSTVLKEKRKLWVYVPESANDPTYLKQRYPVMYLLDGDAHFPSVTSMLQLMSRAPNTVCPEMIVVGIPNTSRTRDLTPSQATSADFMPAAELKTSGGGENFTAFLEKELIPYVDAHYPTSSHRTLIGHSFGGLLVMNTLLHHPALFENYVALDPSMFWDEGKLLKQAHEILAQPQFAGRSLFVASANTTGLDSAQAAKDPLVGGQFTRSKWQLRNELTHNRGNGLRAAYKYYPNDTHNSVPLPGTYDALRFLFQPYALSPSLTNDILNPEAKTAASLEAHYRQVSAQVGYQVLPPESFVNEIAYYLLYVGQPTPALALFQLNARNYPSSFNSHDSLGDYYTAQGQSALAATAFTKALQLKENPATRQKLTQLQTKKQQRAKK